MSESEQESGAGRPPGSALSAWAVYTREVRATLRLALPIAGSQLAQISIGLIDALMLGRLGVIPLGAAGVANTFYSLAIVFGIGLLTPIGVLTARAHGRGRDSECGEILRGGLTVAIAFAAAMAVLFTLGAGFLDRLGQPPEIVEEARTYLVVVGWSLVPTLFFQSFRQFSEAFSRAWAPLAILVAGLALKGLLNWILIFGNLGSPQFGLQGAGWATLAARGAMAAALLVFVLRSPLFRGRLPLRWAAGLPRNIGAILKLGLPVGGQHLFEVGAFSAAILMMGWLGAVALAAHQVTISVAVCTFMVAVGLSFATSIRVGHAAGQGDLAGVRQIGFTSFSMGIAVMGCFGLIFFFLGEALAALFVTDPEVIRLAGRLLKVAALLQICDGLQVVALGALRGITDVRVPSLLTFIIYWLVAIPACYVAGFLLDWGPIGVWVGLAVGLGLASMVMVWRFHWLTRPAVRPA